MSKYIPVSGVLVSTIPTDDSLDNIRVDGVAGYYPALEVGDIVYVTTPNRIYYTYRVESRTPRPSEHIPDIIIPNYSHDNIPYTGNLIFVKCDPPGGTGGSGTSGTSGTSGSGGGGSGTSGTSGTSGIGGSSGTSGVSGTSGTSGTSGGQGTSGSSGSSGLSGTSGSSGSSGTSGISGISGTSGSSGTSGLSGSSGTSGISGTGGTSGTSGLSGSSGTSGIDGISGTDGTSGSSGTSGISGIDGSSGTSGTDGSSGTSGTDGSSGTSGIDGISGTDGSSGTSGSSGTDGSSGTSGSGFQANEFADLTNTKVDDIEAGPYPWVIVVLDDLRTSGAGGPPGDMSQHILVWDGFSWYDFGTFVSIPGTSGTSGISGTSGTSSTGGGAGDGTIPLGALPSGESYDDGLIPLDEDTQVNSAVDQLNGMLALLAPARPGMLTSQTLVLSDTTRYSAKLPSGLTAAWYADGSVAGATITDYVVDNIFRIFTPDTSTRFYNGIYNNPGGLLSLLRDNVSIDSIQTITAGSSTMIVVSDVSTYNSIWSKANAYAYVTQSNEGYRKYEFQHELAGKSNATSIRYDDVASTPSFGAALSIVENTKVSKWLSGIEYYGVGSTFNISYTAASGIFTKAYHPTTVASVSQNVGAFATFSQNPIATPAYTDTFVISNYTVTLNVANKSSNAPTITVTLNKPDGKTAISTANISKNVCTYGTVSTVTTDYFFDEAQRLVIGTDTAWTSTSALVNGNAQVRNGTLQYPNNVEYPGFTGNQEYQRKITKASASTGSITFGTLTAAQVGAYGSGDINILMCLDIDGQYFDLGRVVGDNNGDGSGTSRSNSKGGRVSSSGNTINWSIGTYSTANNNNQYRLIIIFRNTTRTITSLVGA